jgi:putative transposase
MCRILEVHRSGFYAWRHAPLSRRAREDQRLSTKIKQFWMESGCNYGYCNIALDLKETGETCGKNRVLRLMRSLNIASHRRYRRYRGFISGDLSCVAENRLNRQFDTPLPNLRWVTDFTSIRTKEGWLYATIVMNLFSRRVIGWSLSTRATSESIMDALLMAVWRRQPKEPVLIHSDRGAQYTARDWLEFLKAHRLEVSMSQRGNCHDNAVAESFFSNLQLERVRKKV